jgi:hypothetical protein
MPRRSIPFLLISLSFVFSACGKVKELRTLASSAKNAVTDSAREQSTTKATSAAVAAYTPPADGHLTGSQIENYIKIRQRAKQYEEAGRHDLDQRIKDGEGKNLGVTDVVGSYGALANVVAGEEKATKDLGYDTAEYEWVRTQLLDASEAGMSDMAVIAAQKIAAKEQADLQRSLDTTTEESSREIYRTQMAENDKKLKDGLAAVEPHSPAATYNAQLLAKYEDVARPFYEALYKGTGHEAEITKAIQALKDPLAQP